MANKTALVTIDLSALASAPSGQEQPPVDTDTPDRRTVHRVRCALKLWSQAQAPTVAALTARFCTKSGAGKSRLLTERTLTACLRTLGVIG